MTIVINSSCFNLDFWARIPAYEIRTGGSMITGQADLESRYMHIRKNIMISTSISQMAFNVFHHNEVYQKRGNLGFTYPSDANLLKRFSRFTLQYTVENSILDGFISANTRI